MRHARRRILLRNGLRAFAGWCVMTPKDKPVRVQPSVLERAAHILGPHSAAQQALADIVRRREAGEDPAIWLYRGTYIVGPDLAREEP
jgi:hypothetical protein